MGEKMHFKLFLKLEHKEVEVRRLSCEVSSDYENFRNLVRKAFSYLPNDDFLLKWEDEDGDKVAISSDEEFKFALSQPCMSKEVFRVDVEIFENPWWKQLQRSSDRTWGNCLGEEHPGINCNCCQQQVRGFRYKCLSCTNVDICGSCEDKGMHPAHDMIRISSAESLSKNVFENISRLYNETIKLKEVSPEREFDDNVIKGEIELVLETPIINVKDSMSLKYTETSQEDDLETEVEVAAELRLGSICNDDPKKEEDTDISTSEKINNEDDIPSSSKNIHVQVENIITEKEISLSLNNKNEGNDLADNQKKQCFNINEDTPNEIFPISDQQAENKTILTKEELESFETNIETNNEKHISSEEPVRNIQEEIESLLAPLTPLPDLESVSNVMKLKTAEDTNIDATVEKYDKETIPERYHFSFPPDKKSKDRENSAIASCSNFGTSSIHSCLENSLRKLEDTMKNTSTKFEEYGDKDSPDPDQSINNDLTGSRLFIFLRV